MEIQILLLNIVTNTLLGTVTFTIENPHSSSSILNPQLVEMWNKRSQTHRLRHRMQMISRRPENTIPLFKNINKYLCSYQWTENWIGCRQVSCLSSTPSDKWFLHSAFPPVVGCLLPSCFLVVEARFVSTSRRVFKMAFPKRRGTILRESLARFGATPSSRMLPPFSFKKHGRVHRSKYRKVSASASKRE